MVFVVVISLDWLDVLECKMDNFFYDNVVFWFELKILVGGVVFCGMAILEVNIYFEVYFMLGLFDVMVVEEELEL